MFNPLKTKKVLGLDIGYETIKLVEVKSAGKSIRLVGACDQPLTERIMELDHFKDKAKTANLIKEAMKRAKPHPITAQNVVSALPESFVFSKTIQLPKMSEGEYAKMIESQAAQFLPIPVEEAYIDYQVLIEHPNEPLADLLFVAAPKKLIDEFIEVIRLAGLELFALETKPIAVGRAAKTQMGLTGAVIAEIGSELTRVSIWDNSTIRLTTTLAVGQNQLKRALGAGDETQSILGSISGTALATSITDELLNSIKYHQNRDYNPNPITKIYLCGSGARIRDIDKCIEKELKIETKIIKPNLEGDVLLGTEFITSFGLALRGALE